jgi:hypothetical protein
MGMVRVKKGCNFMLCPFVFKRGFEPQGGCLQQKGAKMLAIEQGGCEADTSLHQLQPRASARKPRTRFFFVLNSGSRV